MSLLDGLLDARRPVQEAFDESKIRRDPHGEFAKKIGELANGGAFTMAGVRVARTSPPGSGVGAERTHYRISTLDDRGTQVARGGTPSQPDKVVASPGEAARVAVGRSLASKHPASLGGAKSYSSLSDLPGNAGGGKEARIDLSKAPGGKADRARVQARAAVRSQKPAKLGEDELPDAVGEGSWSKNVGEHVSKLHGGIAKDSETLHREQLPDGTLGPYSPERTALHEHIIDLLTRHAGEHKGKARAIFLAGGPASGKSSLVKSGKVELPADAVDVNPDVVRTMLPEYRRLIELGDKEASAKTHEEASHLSKMVMNVALDRQHHVVVDGVGAGEPGKFAGKIEATRRAGHTAEVHVVTIPTQEAIDRAKARAERSGREVPLGYLRAAHREVSARFDQDVRKLPVAVHVYDNSAKTKEPPKRIASKSASQKRMQVLDRERYLAFLAKGREALREQVAWWL